MTKSVILKNLMTTFIVAAIILFVIRAFHRFVMRSVESYDYLPTKPQEHEYRNDYRGYIGHHDFKRRSKV
jgi:hypothetical protein